MQYYSKWTVAQHFVLPQFFHRSALNGAKIAAKAISALQGEIAHVASELCQTLNADHHPPRDTMLKNILISHLR
jgi:hypothetical protein